MLETKNSKIEMMTFNGFITGVNTATEIVHELEDRTTGIMETKTQIFKKESERSIKELEDNYEIFIGLL